MTTSTPSDSVHSRTVSAIAPLLSANSANAAIVPADDDTIVAEDVTYAAPGGEKSKPLARLSSSTRTGLSTTIFAMWQDGWRLPVFGGLAVDFLSPQGDTPADEEKGRLMFMGLDMDATVANAEAGRAWLAARQGANGKVGAVGFCWGGGLVNRASMRASPITASRRRWLMCQPSRCCCFCIMRVSTSASMPA